MLIGIGGRMDYFYVTNNEKIWDLLKVKTNREVRFVRTRLIEEGWDGLKNDSNIDGCVFFMFESKADANANKAFISDRKIPARYYSSAVDVYGPEQDRYREIADIDDYLKIVSRQVKTLETMLPDAEESAFKFQYSFRCGNCGNGMDRNDKYCRSCGTRSGEGRFEPRSHQNDALYGCLYVLRVTCPRCGKTWNWLSVGPSEGSFCTDCGVRGLIGKAKETSFFDLPDTDTEEEFNAWLDSYETAEKGV